MNELPLVFGPLSNLIGMLALPVLEGSPPLAVLLFNAGVVPRIGPHRLNVRLARALAAAGHACLRFDLAGHGDSKGVAGESDFRVQSVADLRCAMDHLERTHGIRRFALLGVCSGAVAAFSAALADPRVAGVLMFDGHWYRSRWTTLVWRWKRLRHATWPMLAASLRRRLAARGKSAPPPSLFEAGPAPANPPREVFASGLQALVEREVSVLLMYSGSVMECYSYRAQFRDVFGREPFFDAVRCEFHPDIDHTFLTGEMQRRMVERVRAWADEVAARLRSP